MWFRISTGEQWVSKYIMLKNILISFLLWRAKVHLLKECSAFTCVTIPFCSLRHMLFTLESRLFPGNVGSAAWPCVTVPAWVKTNVSKCLGWSLVCDCTLWPTSLSGISQRHCCSTRWGSQKWERKHFHTYLLFHCLPLRVSTAQQRDTVLGGGVDRAAS